jgi:hypothetical protein
MKWINKDLIAEAQIVVIRDMTLCSLVDIYLTTKLYGVITYKKKKS